ncbi:glycosyltransferase family 4 protein [Fundicoccus ignavus]|nr:glycosyltransferase family 4 protein [Fundicoccus ignavus]
MEDKKKVLILNGQYLPGYKGGGPIQSCVNMIENLSDRFDFYVLCADRDYKEEKTYNGIKINMWNQVGKAKVFYLSPEKQTLNGFKKILNETKYDLLYLNGFFSPIFTIKPLLLRRLGKLKNTKIILTPRGDFTGGLENKKVKKYTYIFLIKLIGMYNKLLWHATSDIEEKDIKDTFPKAKVYTVSNLPAKFTPKQAITPKKAGELRLVFVSRIFPKKNIKYALETLKQIKKGKVIFDIYGPMEDKTYWAECEAIIKEMPHNVTVKYCGEAPHAEIPHIFEQYHAFFFPTLGENYGHVIVEAMMNNCLCLLSKGVTPWDDYVECGNFVCSLENKQQFVAAIQELLAMDVEDFNMHLALNNAYIAKKTDITDTLLQYNIMFNNGI